MISVRIRGYTNAQEASAWRVGIHQRDFLAQSQEKFLHGSLPEWTYWIRAGAIKLTVCSKSKRRKSSLGISAKNDQSLTIYSPMN